MSKEGKLHKKRSSEKTWPSKDNLHVFQCCTQNIVHVGMTNTPREHAGVVNNCIKSGGVFKFVFLNESTVGNICNG